MLQSDWRSELKTLLEAFEDELKGKLEVYKAKSQISSKDTPSKVLSNSLQWKAQGIKEAMLSWEDYKLHIEKFLDDFKPGTDNSEGAKVIPQKSRYNLSALERIGRNTLSITSTNHAEPDNNTENTQASSSQIGQKLSKKPKYDLSSLDKIKNIVSKEP